MKNKEIEITTEFGNAYIIVKLSNSDILNEEELREIVKSAIKDQISNISNKIFEVGSWELYNRKKK